AFITDTASPIAMTTVFLFLTAIIVIGGVDKGIEKLSRILMPALVVLIIIISGFSLSLSYTDADNVTRTGLEGLKILFIPDFTGITVKGLFSTMMDAMGQLFYSLSVAMGIMIAYGSYLKDDTNLIKSVGQIEIFDTGIAYLAGVMVIPAVFVFMGKDGMQSGPGLMFVSLPKVFAAMGSFGTVVGCLFFAMVLFAAVTSAVSILEAIVSSFMDEFHMTRRTATIVECIIAWLLGLLVCLGYNKLYFNITLPNGAEAQILDIMDYASNNILMPVVTIGTCILVGWILKPDIIIAEATKNGEKFGREKLYRIMIRYVSPVLLLILLLRALGIF
ncbi:MAG: sodium-dependent transporter, partial [Lachnospiraceae bacterium]|nr:sodium-dependent transporter [Lachnospiraceae bacterium]